MIAENDASIENYITQKTLDGLYLMMADEERAIRTNLMGQTKELQSIFGALKPSR